MSYKALLIAVVLFGTLLARAFCQDPTHRSQDELIAADRGIWQAIAGSHPDIERVSKVLAPDYVDVDSGVRHSREEAIQYLQGLTKFSFQYENATASLLSPMSGYVVAEVSYSSVQNGNAAAGKLLTTTVFSKEHGQWIAHLHTEMDMKQEAR